MAITDLLMHLEAGDDGVPARDFALSLAAQLGAHLTAGALAIQYLAPSTIEDAGSYEAYARLTEESRANAESAYKTLTAAAPDGVHTDLVVIEALAQIARDRFGELARHFDLSIVSQGNPEFGDEGKLVVQGALFNSGKPVFIVPFIHKGPAKLGKAIVCWDGGAAAARALAGALPLLRRAGEVEVAQIVDKDDTPEDLPGFNIARHLARHDINAEVRKLPPADDVGAAILSHVADRGADYLVMGGYGHWKLAEFMFGGVTRTILNAMTVPVFMAH